MSSLAGGLSDTNQAIGMNERPNNSAAPQWVNATLSGKQMAHNPIADTVVHRKPVGMRLSLKWSAALRLTRKAYTL